MHVYQLVEALKPSQYRSLVKGWDKNKLAKEFQNQPYKKDKNAYRIFIPVPTADNIVVEPNPQIKQYLDNKGFEIVDYTKGQVKKKSDGRIFRLGRVLPDELKQTFANDPSRQATKKETLAVISRHPYDIAGMSTDRGWTSCQDLVDGSMCAYVPSDIEAGTLIAYEIDKKDLNINKPLGRILIKPYLNHEKETAYGIASQSYGTVSQNFKDVVMDWIEEFNRKQGVKGFFILHTKVYGEARPFRAIQMHDLKNLSQKELLHIGISDSELFTNALEAGAKPTEDTLAAILSKGKILGTLYAAYKNNVPVTPRAQRAALSSDPIRAIRMILRYDRENIDLFTQEWGAHQTNYKTAADYYEEYQRANMKVPPSVKRILANIDDEVLEM